MANAHRSPASLLGPSAHRGRINSNDVVTAPLLTLNEQRVLRKLKKARTPLGAYDIINALGLRSPATVYRALKALSKFGFVHRLASQNRFVACDHPKTAHHPGFILCQDCGAAVEVNLGQTLALLRSQISKLNFTVETTTIEIVDRCRACHKRKVHDPS